MAPRTCGTGSPKVRFNSVLPHTHSRRSKPQRFAGVALFCNLALVTYPAHAQYPTNSQIAKDGTAIALVDYASVPLSGRTGTTNFSDQLGRVNFLRSEPTNAPLSAARLFVNDLNRNFY